jgi:phosphoglycolate phosphatase
MNYELLIWDFDGTLADSLPRAAEIYNELAAAHGLPTISDTMAVREMTIREFLRAHRIPFHKVPFLTARFLARQKQHSGSLTVFPGLAEVVRQLNGSGLRLGIVSSNDPGTIEDCLRQNDLGDCFEFQVGCSRLFGKQRAIRNVVRAAGVRPDRALYVGDETRDIEAARRVGVPTAAVTWGFNSERLLRQFGPSHVINQPEELLEVCGGNSVNPPG